MENRHIFRQSAYRVRSTKVGIHNLDQLFAHFLNKSNDEYVENSHNLWHINRMTPARVLRKLFATPKHLPKNAGLGIDRYVIIDSVTSESYELPTTDCSNMFVYQASGLRRIHLQPTRECHHRCRRISVRLKPNHIREYFHLFYFNGLYGLVWSILIEFKWFDFHMNSVLRLVVLETSVCSR